MNVVTLTELVIFALFSWVVTTQLILPLWSGKPVFPWFSMERHLRHELKEANQEVYDAKLEKKIHTRDVTADKIRDALEEDE